MHRSETDRLQVILDAARHAVFFGGAGVSTESGIPDFRSQDGLYRQTYTVPPETILSSEYFYAHTEKFYRFYKDKMLCLDAKPNAAHQKLAEMERAGILSAVVTQNIDGLHQAAGSRRVFELHGSIHRNFCLRCKMSYDGRWMLDALGSGSIPLCPQCGGLVKPDVVLYGESLPDEAVNGALVAIQEADVLIVGGTSLSVYPAAAYIRYFRGKQLVILNRDATPADSMAQLCIHDKIGEVLSRIHL